MRIYKTKEEATRDNIVSILHELVDADRETALVLCQGLDGYLMGDEEPDDEPEVKRMRSKAQEAYQTLRELLAQEHP